MQCLRRALERSRAVSYQREISLCAHSQSRRRIAMRTQFALAGAVAAVSIAPLAQAADTYYYNEPPRGAGSEVGVSRVGDRYRVYEGPEIGGYMGVGYGLGAGGRLGYSFPSGVYAGGAFTYFTGNASFVGG